MRRSKHVWTLLSVIVGVGSLLARLGYNEYLYRHGAFVFDSRLDILLRRLNGAGLVVGLALATIGITKEKPAFFAIGALLLNLLTVLFQIE